MLSISAMCNTSQWLLYAFVAFAETVTHEAITKTVTITTTVTPTNCPTSPLVAGQCIIVLMVDPAFLNACVNISSKWHRM